MDRYLICHHPDYISPYLSTNSPGVIDLLSCCDSDCITLSVAAMADKVLALHVTYSWSFARKLELKEIGQDKTAFSFTGTRQCRLLDQ